MKKFLKSYLNNRPFFYVFIRPRELGLFEKRLPFKKPILDFGCGDGFFAKVLFGNSRIDVGIDVDKTVLHEAKESRVYRRVLTYDGVSIPFNGEEFSTVFSNCVMEHVDNLNLSLNEISRVMKKGGKFYVSVMTDMWESYLIGAKFLGKRYAQWLKKIQKHPNLLSVDGWKKAFKEAGFEVVEQIGYLGKNDSHLLELSHYLSVDSLISKRLFDRWVLFPGGFSLLEKYLLRFCKKAVTDQDNSAAVFFTLRKI